MKIDAHHHIWNYVGYETDYVWMTDDFSVLKHDFSMVDFEPLLNSMGYQGAVAVQAREMVAETDFLLAAAGANPMIKAVVGWLDLCSADVERQLEHYSGHPKLMGLRMLIHDREDVDFAVSVPHLNGTSKLEKFNLTYDLLLKPPHLPAAIKLVDALPNQKFVVDHIAKPDIKNQVFEPWLTGIKSIARRPNVYCKLSSVITQADWESWNSAGIFPYLDHVLEAFGPSRIMIGSDWPVSLLAADYAATMGLLENWAEKLSHSEQDAFFGGNCAAFYGIGAAV
jgi:L-fuconolactonase